MIKFLNGNWNLESEWINHSLKAVVPGSIYNDLHNNKMIPEPYYRDNEAKMLDYMKYDYTYYRTFKINANEIKKVINLVFLGLDTITEVYINDHLIMETFNMHRRYKIIINDYLVIGENQIKIKIKSCLAFIENEKKKCTHELMQMSYAVKGYNLIRKAHCMFGWDWGPQMPDGGIWRDVYLEIFDKAKIDEVEIRQNTTRLQSDLKMNILNTVLKKSKIQIRLLKEEEIVFTEIQEVKEKNYFEIIIENPILWYPKDYGQQFLYDLEINILDKDNVIDTYREKIGLRKMEIIQKKDQFGTSFTFQCNEQPIFLKGADYIIEDNIFPRRDNKKTKFLLEQAAICHHNAIRVWGGAIYPDDYFYQLCDELGLIVWQDIMFACGYYNMENERFVEEVRLEIIDNLKRIRNHCCLGLICGNNENETAINWNVPSIEYTKKWYLYQYEEFIPKIVHEYAPDIFYWPSSPSSGGGFDNPNDDSRGDMHYWGVWHNNEPIDHYRLYYPRVMSEFGMQSFPDIETIKTFTIPEDRNIFSWVMEHHQKNNSANQKIINYIGSYFKYPKDFEALTYLSQLIQAEAVRYCVEHLRRNYGRCMGSIYWQLNDCWPVASWSSIDYYNHFKALQYYSKKFYAPFIISIEEDRLKQTAKIVITNEQNIEVKGAFTWELMHFSGVVLEMDCQEFSIDKYSTKTIANLKFELIEEVLRTTVLRAVIRTDKDEIYENQVSFYPDKYLEFDNPKINYSLELLEQSNKNRYVIKMISNRYAKYVRINVKTKENIIFSDNFFCLYPHEEKKIYFYTKSDIKKEQIKIYSLINSY